MTVTLYKSTDGSAPVLTGEVGKLVALLDAILVNGYGAKPAAGWTKAFSGVNKAAYRQGAGAQFYLRVQDDGPGAGGAKEARMRGYETMSDVDTGTGDFPTTVQLAAGIIARKSNTADATARPWIALADAQTVYLFALTGDGSGVYLAWLFGGMYSAVPGDAYNCIIIGRTVENNATITSDRLDLLQSATSQVGGGVYLVRAYTGLGTALNAGRHGDVGKSSGASSLSGNIQYPNGADGGLYVSHVWVHEAGGNTVRARMRGFYHFLHTIGNVGDGDTFSGVGDLAGKTFLILKQTGNAGVYVMETSNTWETN